MGWAAMPNPEWATILPAAWNNANAGLPAEWQLRYLANIELFDERPWIQDKIPALYALRRHALRRELERVNAQYHVFEHIGLDDDTTIYNWSKLPPGEDVFSLFEKTASPAWMAAPSAIATAISASRSALPRRRPRNCTSSISLTRRLPDPPADQAHPKDPVIVGVRLILRK